MMYRRFIISLLLPVEKVLGGLLISMIINHPGVIRCEAGITVFLAYCFSDL